MNISTQIPISEARANFPDLVEKINKYSDTVVITVNGKPKVALISTDELESLEETAQVMAIPNIKRGIVKSRNQIKRGQYIKLEDLK